MSRVVFWVLRNRCSTLLAPRRRFSKLKCKIPPCGFNVKLSVFFTFNFSPETDEQMFYSYLRQLFRLILVCSCVSVFLCCICSFSLRLLFQLVPYIPEHIRTFQTFQNVLKHSIHSTRPPTPTYAHARASCWNPHKPQFSPFVKLHKNNIKNLCNFPCWQSLARYGML